MNPNWLRLTGVLPLLIGLAGSIGLSPATPPTGHEDGPTMRPVKSPLDQAHLHVCGIHFVNGDIKRQVTAHHYCIVGDGDVAQCVLFDGVGKDAKLIGIEYIVGESVFKTLPDDEKALWHSHDYEVKSGLLIAPGMPEAEEHALMAKLVNTYGKTVHTWQVDRGDKLPLGAPTVMMGFTGDGQVKPELVERRDKDHHVSLDAKRQSRRDIPQPALPPGVNAWQGGHYRQLKAGRYPADVDFETAKP